MRKRVLSLALLCCFAPPFGLIHAAETEQAEFLVLKMADSKTAEFKLSTRPVIAFSDDKLQITSDEISTDYPQSDVTEFYFTAISTGIEEKVNPSTMSFSYTDNATIRISGALRCQRQTATATEGKRRKRYHQCGLLRTGCVYSESDQRTFL